MKDRTKRPLILQGRTILLETKAKQTEKARAFISSIADLKESPETLHTYVITDLSLWNAACAGVDIEQIIYNLDFYSKYPIPKDLEDYIRSMLGRYGLVKLHPHPKSTLFNTNPSSGCTNTTKEPLTKESLTKESLAEESLAEESLAEESLAEDNSSEKNTIPEKQKTEKQKTESNSGVHKPIKRRRIVRRTKNQEGMVKKSDGEKKSSISRPSIRGRSTTSSLLNSDLTALAEKAEKQKQQKKQKESCKNTYDDLIRLQFASAFISQEVAREPTLRQYMVPDENRHWAIHAKDRGIFKQRALQAGWPIEDLTGFIDGAPLPMKIRETTKSGSTFALRDYQVEAAQKWYRKGLPSGGCGVVVLACGAGKTIVGLHCMSLVQQKTLILANNQTAVNQWIREILDKTDLTEDMVGAYSGESKCIRPVTVATYQIMTWRKSRKDEYAHIHLFDDEDWGLIIYDEVHLLPAPVFTRTASLQGRRRLGLTATLIREDGREGDVFSLVGPKVYELPWKHITQLASVLCHEVRIPMPQEWIEKQEKSEREREIQSSQPLKQVTVISQKPSSQKSNEDEKVLTQSQKKVDSGTSKKSTTGHSVVHIQRPTSEQIQASSFSGDLRDNKRNPFVRDSLRKKNNKMNFYREVSSNPRKLEVVQSLLRRHKYDYVLVIGTYVEQLKRVAKILDCPLIEGSTPNKLRDKIFSEFKLGKQKVIVVSKVANFAVDLPNANIAIQISGSFGSRQEEAQRIGRIMRPKGEGVEAHFYSVVTDHPAELNFAHKRQLFMTEQGYRYTIDDVQLLLDTYPTPQ
jgi:superfamily II DNA or RNA helicase